MKNVELEKELINFVEWILENSISSELTFPKYAVNKYLKEKKKVK